MPTFAGAYVQEPSDFTTVATEAALIQSADDPSAPTVPADVTAWSDLTPEEQAALVATINPIIVRKEGLIDGYLRAGGYAVPIDTDRNPIILDYAVRLVWNDLRYRKEQLSDEQYREANRDILAELALIGQGQILLAAAASEEEPPTGAVYAIGTTERIFSRDTLEDF